MKKLFLFLLMVVFFNLLSFGQNAKCLTISNDIIKDLNGKILNQFLNTDQIYVIKVELEPKYDISKVKMACDTTKAKVNIDWKLNYDKNWEKQLMINGKTMNITFYPNDKYLYFEFPK